MTWDEAAALLSPEQLARLTAQPPPLRPEQVSRCASLLLGEPVRAPQPDHRTDAA